MRAIAAWLIVGTLAALVTAHLFYVRWLRTERAAAQRIAQVAQHGNLERDAVIQTLRAQIHRQAQAQAHLAAERTRIHTTQGQRTTFMKQQQHESPTLRAWANTPLPAVLIRLRDHPAFTRAADYYLPLSDGDALSAACDRPQNERGTQPHAGSGGSGMGGLCRANREGHHVPIPGQ